MAKRLGGRSRKAAFAVAVTWALGGVGLALQACDDDSTHNGTVTPQPDGATADTSTSLPDGAFDVVPTGDVKGNINYFGAKRGTVVIAFLDHIPAGPPAPGEEPPKVGGFGIANPQTFPGTFATKVAPGTWMVSAYMSVGQPPHLDGPTIGPGGVPTEPVGVPAQIVVNVGQTTNVDIQLIDLPPPGDGGDEGGSDAGPDADTEDAD